MNPPAPLIPSHLLRQQLNARLERDLLKQEKNWLLKSGLLRSRLAKKLLLRSPSKRQRVVLLLRSPFVKKLLLRSRLRKQNAALLLVQELEAHAGVDNMLWDMIRELRAELEMLRGQSTKK